MDEQDCFYNFECPGEEYESYTHLNQFIGFVSLYKEIDPCTYQLVIQLKDVLHCKSGIQKTQFNKSNNPNDFGFIEINPLNNLTSSNGEPLFFEISSQNPVVDKFIDVLTKLERNEQQQQQQQKPDKKKQVGSGLGKILLNSFRHVLRPNFGPQPQCTNSHPRSLPSFNILPLNSPLRSHSLQVNHSFCQCQRPSSSISSRSPPTSTPDSPRSPSTSESESPRRSPRSVGNSDDIQIRYMKFSWENLFYFGNPIQQYFLNIFRRCYVKLLQQYLSSRFPLLVNFDSVGTTLTTHASDYDINVKLEDIVFSDVIDEIFKYHYAHFFDSLSKMFDVNFYGLFIDGQLQNMVLQNYSINQRLWSFLRTYEETPTFFGDFSNLISNVNILLQNITIIGKKIDTCSTFKVTNNALNKLQNLQQIQNVSFCTPTNSSKYTVYKIIVDAYLENIPLENIPPEKKTLLFSLGNYFADETYRSVGGYLDIVGNCTKSCPINNNLINYLIDSIIDNHGFLIANLVHHPEHAEPDIVFKMGRVAKYLNRMCNTYSKIRGTPINLINGIIHNTGFINNARKKCDNITIEEIKKILLDPLCLVCGVSPIVFLTSTLSLRQQPLSPPLSPPLQRGHDEIIIELINLFNEFTFTVLLKYNDNPGNSGNPFPYFEINTNFPSREQDRIQVPKPKPEPEPPVPNQSTGGKTKPRTRNGTKAIKATKATKNKKKSR